METLIAAPVVTLPKFTNDIDVSTLDPVSIAQDWLDKLNLALQPAAAGKDYGVDDDGIQVLLTENPAPFWKDHLAMTWDLRTMHSAGRIIAMLKATIPLRQLSIFTLSSARLVPLVPGLFLVQVIFNFTTDVAICSGVAKLVPIDNKIWKAWVVFTKMEEIKGSERDLARLDVPDHVELHTERRVDALIIGAGQAGMQMAAQLRVLGLSTVLVERQARVGDQWLDRYDSLKLHVKKYFCNMAYRHWPDTAPLYPSRVEVAEYFRYYASSTHINVLPSTEVQKADFDSKRDSWIVTLRSADGSFLSLEVRHLVMATGISGRDPYIPTMPGQDEFRGTIMHSSLFKNGEEWKGKETVVIGVGSSGHDVARSLYEAGAEVTMYQRSPTMHLSRDLVRYVQDPYFNDQVPIELGDMLWESNPVTIVKLLCPLIPLGEAAKATEAGLLERGFLLKPVDLAEGIWNRYGGLYIDSGGSAMIADGKIALKSGTQIRSFSPEGVLFEDGSQLPADLIVLATGWNNHNMLALARSFVSEEIGAKLKQPWGIDDEGHVFGAYKNSGHPRLWYLGGDFGAARYYTRLVALQIKATESGILQRAVIPVRA